jgi:hypothetical protein
LLILLVVPSEQLSAKRRFAFDDNFAYIGEVCRDGVEIAIGNDDSHNQEGGDPHTGEGVQVIFTAQLLPDLRPIADETTLTQTYHEVAVDWLFSPEAEWPPLHVYAFEQLYWHESLAPGQQVYLRMDGPGDLFEVNVAIGDCYLYPQTPPFGAAITYQGRLSGPNGAANGPFDFQFVLHADGGTDQPVGNVIALENIEVANGLFNVSLDFGASAFDGGARWLAIAVRPGDSSGAYTALTPRQPLTVVPYALHSANTSPHDHLDETWYGDSNPLVITGAYESAPLVLTNLEPSEAGLIIRSGDLRVEAGAIRADGLWVNEASDDGVRVCGTGAGVFCFDNDPGKHGVEVQKTEADGLHIRQAGDNGLEVVDATNDGVRVHNTGDDGMQIGEENNAANFPAWGLYIPPPGPPNEALLVNTANPQGEWALYTGDRILASNLTASSLTVMAIADGPQPLEPGALAAAAGLAQPNVAGMNEIPRVQLADEAAYNGIVGVVESRMELQPAPGKEGVLILHSVPGAAQAGDYVALTIYGVSHVKTAALAGEIAPGQRLTAAQQAGYARALRTEQVNGMVVSEGAPVIGIALAPPDPNSGTIAVLVTLR